ncbi:ribonuclease HI family protein [Jeotgalicoccus meleagridis]|jgi:ribonuclease HI|uniref:14.7 kDa ribonuclease H-like protein n=1 Tax=Jeotgalicoccus meleagridis TaxID=2759181 RepID=A0A6V7RHV7_9STAP|nr:ribonuclease HI family protein [Jeotgalicoccus meleagridis]CAD2077626.1 14.7 kDa ribonuclease H-like protein [Jeotgalicoccus meleagridis]HIW37633.1 ribonuclease HI family protein [Candidatus Jeotgalicoccus stercoravium]
MAIMYIDAAASIEPKLAAGGVLIKTDDATYEASTFLGIMDNHEAEWATFEFGIEEANRLKLNSLIVYTDSKLIADSFNKGFVKKGIYKSYFDRIQNLSQSYSMLLVSHTPRKKNKGADRLAKDRLYKERNSL